ncbi:Gfo/Idh/MocA family protein [Pontibacillus salicampi]|uniref:Gfo/Idh/MocA family protein n=1 Tax=Pontibacillus salicampi TaxID=1449801 RepID=A0ABV6LSH6_9BACI
MKIAIISFAHMHAVSYAEAVKAIDGVELVGIYDEDVTRGMEMAERFEAAYVASLPQLLAVEVDAVLICSENVHHKQHVLEAARAKKHILCEKPLATTVEDAKEMIRICKEEGVQLQTAFPVRYAEPMQQLKLAITDGAIGDIVAMRGTNRGQNPGGWFVDPVLSGGGAVLDHTVHIVDMMRWIMNEEVAQVHAEVDTLFTDEQVDDAGILTLQFANGVMATHDPSWSRSDAYPAWGDITLEVIGTKGRIYVDALADHLHLYTNRDDSTYTQVFTGADMDQRLIEDFVYRIQSGKDVTITGEDGLQAMSVALAAYRSAKEKRLVEMEV